VAKKTTKKSTKSKVAAPAAKAKTGKTGGTPGNKSAARTGKVASKPTNPRPTATSSATRLVQSAGADTASRIQPAKQTISDANNAVGRLSDDDLRKVKTGLSKKDLEHFRELLLEKRKELLGDVASLETDARNNSGGNLSNMPLHMADIGTDNYDQEFTLGLVESERRLLQEINEALLRIKNGTYGVCLIKGTPIAKARLDIQPWAKYSIEAAREMEKRGIAV
jgi:DnaK suppressor protein